MKEISLHIMDIVQNSITAEATLIEVDLEILNEKNTLSVTITDNGKGMSKEMLDRVLSPFVTTRTTRRVGLGISLFQQGAEATDGSFFIDSVLGEGTVLRATYTIKHLDRPPIGDFSGTMHTLIVCNTSIDFVVKVTVDDTEQQLDTREIREVLGADVPLDTPDVSVWIGENLKEIFPQNLAEF